MYAYKATTIRTVVETENKKGDSTLTYFFRFKFAIGDDFVLMIFGYWRLSWGVILVFLMERGSKQKCFPMHTALEQI